MTSALDLLQSKIKLIGGVPFTTGTIKQKIYAEGLRLEYINKYKDKSQYLCEHEKAQEYWFWIVNKETALELLAEYDEKLLTMLKLRALIHSHDRADGNPAGQLSGELGANYCKARDDFFKIQGKIEKTSSRGWKK